MLNSFLTWIDHFILVPYGLHFGIIRSKNVEHCGATLHSECHCPLKGPYGEQHDDLQTRREKFEPANEDGG